MDFAFFGTDDFSVIVLDELKKAGFLPALIVTATDKKMGRGMRLTPPPVKLWAEENNIKFLQPQKLDDVFYYTLYPIPYTLFLVASYGKIIPKRILDIPTHGALNVHPSLLPLYRGPSPIESQILDGAEEVGVTIMLMDEEMDHGPILAQQELEITNHKSQITNKFQIPNSPPKADPPPVDKFSAKCGSASGGQIPRYTELHDALAHLGGQLLAEIIPKWLAGEITPREQNHAQATYTKKIMKEDGLIDLTADAEKNYRKFLAYSSWPSVYFFKDGKRVKITDAELVDGKFIIKNVVPEGKREMAYELFKKNTRHG